MFRRLRQRVAFTLVVVGLTTPAVAFNPAGRSKKPKAGAAQKPSKAAAPKPGASKPPAAAAPEPAPATRGKGEGQSREALIARYLGIVLAQPGAEFPLERLTQLYRERDGNLERLVAELDERVKQDASPYSALVALGGVYRKDAQPDRAIKSFEQAIGKEPNNP